MRTTLIRGEGGYALMAVIIASAMLLTMGVIGVRSSRMELKISSNELQAQEALAVAEAGLAHAVALIGSDGDGFDDELADSGTGGALVGLGSTATVGGESYRFHAFGGSGTGDGYYVRVVDNFDETDATNVPGTDTDSRVMIVSRGQVGNAQRVVAVSAVPTIAGGPGYGVIADQNMIIGSHCQMDSYDSNIGYAGSVGNETILHSNGGFELSGADATEGNGTELKGMGEAVGTTNLPPEADMEYILDCGAGIGSDCFTESVDPIDLPPVDMCAPGTGCTCNGSGTVTDWSDGTGIVDVSGSNSSYNGQVLSIGSAGEVLLNSGTYCFSDLVVGGSGILRIDGPVNIYLSKKFDAHGGATINDTFPPGMLNLFAGSNTTLDFKGTSHVGMVAYAPEATATFSSDNDTFGALVVKVLKCSGGGKLHYDINLGGGGGGATGLALSHWREVRTF